MALLFHTVGSINVNNGGFGQGSGPIYLSNLRCNGSEARITDCATVEGRACTHREDAGVRCLIRTGL